MQGKNLISYPLTPLEKPDFSFGVIKEENDISGFFFFLSFFTFSFLRQGLGSVTKTGVQWSNHSSP